MLVTMSLINCKQLAENKLSYRNESASARVNFPCSNQVCGNGAHGIMSFLIVSTPSTKSVTAYYFKVCMNRN